jgi:hypothetical protein
MGVVRDGGKIIVIVFNDWAFCNDQRSTFRRPEVDEITPQVSKTQMRIAIGP